MMTLPVHIASRCPVLSVPSGLSRDGVPTGLPVVGKTYDDVAAFRVAAAHEATFPWLAGRARPAARAAARIGGSGNCRSCSPQSGRGRGGAAQCGPARRIRLTYHDKRTSQAERRRLAEGRLALQGLRATVQAKRDALDGFLADLDARIGKAKDLLASGDRG